MFFRGGTLGPGVGVPGNLLRSRAGDQSEEEQGNGVMSRHMVALKGSQLMCCVWGRDEAGEWEAARQVRGACEPAGGWNGTQRSRQESLPGAVICHSLSEGDLCSVSCLGHSMMDTLAVALRVAEEAIEEAISKAEAYGDSLVMDPLIFSGEVWVRVLATRKKCRLSGNQCHQGRP